MTRKNAQILLEKIVPIITATVPRVVRPTVSEDAQELVQDTIATAAEMLDSVERSGKKPIPRSIAFYSIQRAKSGRRAYQNSGNDLLSPVFRTVNENRLSYLDAPVSEDAENMTMHEFVAGHTQDHSVEVLRRLDWEDFSKTLDRREKLVVKDTAEGRQVRDTAKELGVSSGRIVQIKRLIGNKIRTFFGDNIIAEAGSEPVWKKDLRALREKQEWHYSAMMDNEPEAA